MNNDPDKIFERMHEATNIESPVERIEHAMRVTNTVVRAKTKTPPYCRASVTPSTMGGYTPCMKLLPCPLHGDNPSYYEREEK
jgi:hypothetical protein